GAANPAATSAAARQASDGQGAQKPVADFQSDVQLGGTSFGTSRTIAQGLAADGAVHDSQRTALLRATRLQPAVPLVPGPGIGRAELRPFQFHQQPQAAAGARGGRGVLPRSAGTSPSAQAALQ